MTMPTSAHTAQFMCISNKGYMKKEKNNYAGKQCEISCFQLCLEHTKTNQFCFVWYLLSTRENKTAADKKNQPQKIIEIRIISSYGMRCIEYSWWRRLRRQQQRRRQRRVCSAPDCVVQYFEYFKWIICNRVCIFLLAFPQSHRYYRQCIRSTAIDVLPYTVPIQCICCLLHLGQLCMVELGKLNICCWIHSAAGRYWITWPRKHIPRERERTRQRASEHIAATLVIQSEKLL